MDASTVDGLLSNEGQALLASLPPYAERDAVALTARLRTAGHTPELVAAALTQSRLRARAAEKFGPDAATMLFTPDALEQATRAAVAARHAERFRRAGITHVLDGGCGIGADSVGFARAGLRVTAIEADTATARLAQHNLSFADDATVETGLLDDVAPRLPTDEHTAWWFDPARRVTGVADITGRTKRTFSLAALSPDWGLVQRLAAETPAAGAKLSPGLAHADVPVGTEAEFTSFAGDVVEATIWWGAARETEGISATILRPVKGSGPLAVDAVHVTASAAEGAQPTTATLDELGTYLYEADKALTRSGLVGALQNLVDGQELATGFGYVTADNLVDVGLLGRRYRITDALPLHVKTLRSQLRAAGVGRVTIKKRDIDLDADQLRRELKLKGHASAMLVLATVSGTRMALIVEPA